MSIALHLTYPFSILRKQQDKQKEASVDNNPKHRENHLYIGRWKLYTKHIATIWTRAVVLCPPVYTVFVKGVSTLELGRCGHVFITDGTFVHCLII